MKNVWLARMIDVKINAPPPRPKITKPGRTKISVKRQMPPVTNSVTSNQPAVPSRKRLQKKRANAPRPRRPRCRGPVRAIQYRSPVRQQDQHRHHFRPAEETGDGSTQPGRPASDRSPARSSLELREVLDHRDQADFGPFRRSARARGRGSSRGRLSPTAGLFALL